MSIFCNRLTVKSAFCAACITGIAPAAPAQSPNSHIHIRQANTATDGNDVGRTQILVDGPTTLGYDGVTNEALDVWVSVYIEKSNSTPSYHSLVLQAESIEIKGEVTAATRRYKFTIPYAHPRSGSVTGQRNSAVAACNGRLASLNGSARTSFLREGAEISVTGAYRLKAVATYTTTKAGKGGTFPEAPRITEHTDEDVAMANAVIVCRPLDRPRPRTSTTTTGATPKPGKPLPPVITAAELRMEPAKVTQVGKQMCPAELRLYGRVEASRAFNGKAVIFGTGFLSPVSALSYDGPGNRNIVATYPLSWSGIGGLAGTAPSSPRAQTVTLTLNVTNADNKVLESIKETVTVTCKPTRVSSGSAIGGAIGAKAGDGDRESSTVDPQMWSWHEAARANEPVAARARSRGGPITFEKSVDAGTPSVLPPVDAHIRKVDRGGPGGATRLWLRNGGTQKAENCELAVRRESDKGWILVDAVSLAPGETREITAAMPRDPGLEFVVTCPGEADALLANNTARLR